MWFLYLITLFFTFSPSFAEVTIDRINTGYSRIEGRLANDVNETTTTIYGGVAGAVCGDNSLSDTPCDNCSEVGSGSICNSRRIFNNLKLTFYFTYKNSGSTLGEIMVTTDEENPTELDLFSVSTSGNVDSGNYSVTILWEEICDKFYSGADCDTDTFLDSDPFTLRIGVDSNNNTELDETTEYAQDVRVQVVGMSSSVASQTICSNEATPSNNGPCNFVVKPGDGKVFINNVRAGCGFPSLQDSDGDLIALRVFYEELNIGVTRTKPSLSSPYTDLSLGSSSSTSCSGTQVVALASNEVTGLINDQYYIFAIASLDEANNLGFFTEMNSLPTDIENLSYCYDSSGDNSENSNCHFVAPSEVAGLIEKQNDCFITTAAFGSHLAPKVQDFREFRNQFLHTHWLGRKIIKFYYRNSPPMARWIDQHQAFRPIARLLLYPFWMVAKVFLFSPWLILLLLLSPVASWIGYHLYRRWQI